MDTGSVHSTSDRPNLIEWSITILGHELGCFFRADGKLLLCDNTLGTPGQTKPNHLGQILSVVLAKLHASVKRTNPLTAGLFQHGDLFQLEFEEVLTISKLKPNFVRLMSPRVRRYAAGTQMTSPDDSRVISTVVNSPSLPVTWKLVSMN